MENNTFKSVTFGGFDKQDVIRYIEASAQEHTAALDQLEQEKETLRQSEEALRQELEALQVQHTALETQCSELQDQLTQACAQRDVLQIDQAEQARLQTEAAALRAEVETLRPQAEAYTRLRDGIGNIECEARKRADDLERSTLTRLQQLVGACHTQYRELATQFDATAQHVTTELRKVEVTLTQLPRSMDQVGVQLAELEHALEQKAE